MATKGFDKNFNFLPKPAGSGLTFTVLPVIIVLLIIYCLQRKEPYKPYQCEINKLSRENDIVKDKYSHQDVSQSSIPKQRKDYDNTLAKPEMLASNYKQIFPDDLLPQEKETTDWARANPPGKGSLELKNMLQAGQWIGVDTQGSSLKNANLQIRSEPPNPITPVSIWKNSSITPDMFRKELEIGEATTQ